MTLFDMLGFRTDEENESSNHSQVDRFMAVVNDGPWAVRRLILSRPKQSTSKEVVVREIKKHFLEAADPELEWYLQVSVHSGNVVTFIGEIALSLDDPSKAPPQEELNEMVKHAHGIATFLNINNVELPGSPTTYEDTPKRNKTPVTTVHNYVDPY